MYIVFTLVPKFVSLNHLKRCNGRYFIEIGTFEGRLRHMKLDPHCPIKMLLKNVFSGNI